MSETCLFDKVHEAATYIRSQCDLKPQVGIILGTGLGKFAKQIKIEKEVDYEQIPHFPRSTVQSHKGRLILGELSGKKIVAMEGRFHFYEGYTLEQVTFPVRVMKQLGIATMIVSNAAGGLNPMYEKGDLVVITDHINFMGVNPLIGPNDERFGIRFPDMIEPYDQKLVKLTQRVAQKEKITLREGVYLGVTGPCLETKAEYRFMRQMGGDLVGMSTIPEVIVGVHESLKILGLSVATDLCIPETLEPVNIEEIIKTAETAEPKLNQLVISVLKEL